MRFGSSFQFYLQVYGQNGYNIVPLSVQILMENAFKHNRFSSENPMKIEVMIKDGALVVRNSRNELNSDADSLKFGLENLRGRYHYLTGQDIDLIHSNGVFEVHIPLIKAD